MAPVSISGSWWLSSPRMTILVEIDPAGKISGGAPIIKKFRGQPIQNLADWMRKQGGEFKAERLKDPPMRG